MTQQRGAFPAMRNAPGKNPTTPDNSIARPNQQAIARIRTPFHHAQLGNGSFFADGTPERRREVEQMFAPANRAFAELRQYQREHPWTKFAFFAMAVELPTRKKAREAQANKPPNETRESGNDARPRRSERPPDTQQPPPHSVEGEQGVLSSMLQSPSAVIPIVIKKLQVEDFFLWQHEAIYQAILDMWDSGQGIDLITFTQFLRDNKKLESVGGAAFVTQLYNFVMTAVNVDYYIEIVSEKSRLRQLIGLGTELVRNAYGGDDVSALIHLTDARLYSIRSLDGKTLGGLPAVIDAARLVAGKIVTPDDVIEGIFSVGGKMVWGGGSKTFKTWQLINLATAVGSGGEILGFPTKKGRVLYLNLELQRDWFAWRLKTILSKKKIELEDGAVDVWNLRGHAAELSKLLPFILRQAEKDKYSLIIIDPIYKVHGERQENTDQIGIIMNDLEKIAEESGAAITFGHHFSKGNQSLKEAIDRMSGHGTYGRDPDSIVICTKHEVKDAFTVEMILRNHPPQEPFVVRWEFPLMVRDEELDPNRLKQIKPMKEAIKGDILWKALKKGQFYTSKQILVEIQEFALVKRAKAYDILADARERKIVKFNHLTDARSLNDAIAP